MANIPIPGVDIANLKAFFEQFQVFGILNIFTGGALERLSIVMLGLGPYITAIIIMQLLTLIFPRLEQLYKKEGEEGRRKFDQYGRMLTVPLALLQSFGMLTLLTRQGAIEELEGLEKISAILTVTAGSIFLMWLGELISEKGIGNGVSLLIFAGIVAQFPHNLKAMIVDYDPIKLPAYLLFFIMVLIIITSVVLVNEARRNIPVSYAKRVRGMRMYGGVSTYLPISVNPAGVMPIIFALSILTLPLMFTNFFVGTEGFLGQISKSIAKFFENPFFYGILLFLFVMALTYFYTAIVFDPKSISENLQKMGGFVPGIRPGKSTANFLSLILNRVLLFGAMFLGLIAVMPSIVPSIIQHITQIKIEVFHFLIGGTSVLIIVSVVLDTINRIKAELEMREYEKF